MVPLRSSLAALTHPSLYDMRALAELDLDDIIKRARNCVAALQKRLQHRSANVQLFSLTVSLRTLAPKD